MSEGEPAWSRLILWRPRPGFALPREWADRSFISLGEIRPLLQALSPVHDLSDLWRWVAAPLPLLEVQAVLAPWRSARAQPPITEPGRRELTWALEIEGLRLQARLVVAALGEDVERIELEAAEAEWFQAPSPEAVAAMGAVAQSLRCACGCIAVAL